MTELPGKAKHGGYVYILAFDNGTTKVGATANPASRFKSLQRDAGAFGALMTELWLSPLHQDPYASEAQLLALAAQVGSPRGDREYFTNIDFANLRRKAEALRFSPVTIAYVRDREADAETRGRAFVNAVMQTTQPRSATAGDWYGSLIERLFGRRADGTFNLPTVDPECVPMDLVHEMARRSRRTVDEVLDMSFIDLMEHTITAMVRSEAMRMRAYAKTAGRDDLNDAMPVAN